MRLRHVIVLICAVAFVGAGVTYAVHRSRGVMRPQSTLPHAATSAETTSSATVARVPTRKKENKRSKRHTATAPEPTPASKLTPLPRPGTPLAQSFDELKSRSEAGDAKAASRLYRDLMRCKYSSRWMTTDRFKVARTLAQKPDDTSDDMLAYAQSRQDQADRLATLCAGLDPAVFNQSTPIALHAAQLGDSAARDCYVHRGPFLDSTSLLDNPQYLTNYTQEAPALIDAALADGDWKMVAMLKYAYHSRGVSLISGLVGFDPVQHYRYLKLFSLGADGQHASGYTKSIDIRLKLAAQALSRQQKATADTWAQREFTHFHGSSAAATPRGWNACAIR